MAHLRLSLLLLLLMIFSTSGTADPSFSESKRSRTRAYILSACKTTRYPALCIQYLSGFENSTVETPQQLAQLALWVSLCRARYTRSYMIKVAKELKAMKAREYQAVKDCLDQINDSVDQLGQSIRELRRLGSQGAGAGAATDDVFWHISNVETWVSAAMTDATTCIDEFPGRNISKLKATIKGKVLNVAQATSNALALFHRYAARYRGVTNKNL